MEVESHHGHHHGHGTGIKWLDVVLGTSALVISLVSLGMGLHSAHTMEKLVASNSFPNIDVNMTNLDSKGQQKELRAELSNTGVGPARIGYVTATYEGQSVRTMADLLKRCCDLKKNDQAPKLSLSSGFENSIVPAGRSTTLLRWPEEDTPQWRAMELKMTKLDVNVCYCSVFGECYLTRNGEAPAEVKACVKPKDAYIGRSAS